MSVTQWRCVFYYFFFFWCDETNIEILYSGKFQSAMCGANLMQGRTLIHTIPTVKYEDAGGGVMPWGLFSFSEPVKIEGWMDGAETHSTDGGYYEKGCFSLWKKKKIIIKFWKKLLL